MTRFAPLALALSLVLLSACSGKDKAPDAGEGDGVAVSRALWGQNLADDDTGLALLRYIDSRNIASPSTRGFAVTLPRPRQVGITANYKF